MNIGDIATVVLTTIALLSGGIATIAWFYRRGRQEQTLAHSVERHAQATVELAGQVGGLRDTLERHSGTLVEHHYRIKALEDHK